MRLLIYLAFFLSTTIAPAFADRFDDREKSFVAGLRSRQLFDVAEQYCVNALLRSDITITDQAALTVELLQNRSAKALIAPIDQRAPNWQRVWDTQRDFESRFPSHPKTILVTTQTALARLNYAAAIEQELSAEMIAASDINRWRQTMVEQLRQARRTFESIERDIKRMVPEQRSKSPSDDELSVEQLSIMRSNVRYQLAKCHLQTAYSYAPTDTVNRASITSDVLQRLSEVQNSVSPQQRIWWLAKITQIECLRLIGRNVNAFEVLNRLPDEDRPEDLLSDILEQRLLLAVARADVQWAEKHLRQSTSFRLTDQSPRMDIAQMRTAVMLSQNADSDSNRQHWLNQAAEIVQTITTTHGAYWGRRAGLALIDATGGSTESIASPRSAGQREILTQTAQRSARNGDHDDALKAWQAAIELTPASVQRQRLQISAAKTLERLKRHREAADVLLSGAIEIPQSEIAASMHLRGCWNRAQADDIKTSTNGNVSDTNVSNTNVALETNTGDQLIASLQRHLRQWPEAATADQAALWLSAEFNRRHDFESAISALTAYKNRVSENGVAQLRTTFYTFQQQFNGQKDRVKELSLQIVQHLLQHSANRNEADDAASLIAVYAEIALLSGCLDPAEVAKTIKQHSDRFASTKGAPLQLYNSALAILVQNDLTTATDLLAATEPSEPQCRMLVSIINQRQSQEPKSVLIANQFLLAVTEQALRLPLSLQQTTAWKFEQAKRLRATGQYKRAIALLIPLAQRSRNDASIQLEYARVLSQSDDHAEKALKVWRKLAQQLQPKTESWYEAKFNIGQNLARSGQEEAAEKMLRYVEAVHGWEGSAWAEKIEQLLRQLQSLGAKGYSSAVIFQTSISTP